jgi:hypothetical protein
MFPLCFWLVQKWHPCPGFKTTDARRWFTGNATNEKPQWGSTLSGRLAQSFTNDE